MSIKIVYARQACRGLFAAAVAVWVLGASAVARAVDLNERISGVWLVQKPMFEVRTVDGKLPPLRPEAAQLYRERQAARGRGETSFDNATWCASAGIPRLLFVAHPFEVMARPTHVGFLFQWNWWSRIVHVSDAPPQVTVPGPMGTANGRWEGDNFVVEATGFNAATLIDSAGMPHSDSLKLVERWSLKSPDVLQVVIEIEDPDIFTQPWKTQATYRRQKTRIQEDVCLDRIRDGQPAI